MIFTSEYCAIRFFLKNFEKCHFSVCVLKWLCKSIDIHYLGACFSNTYYKDLSVSPPYIVRVAQFKQ